MARTTALTIGVDQVRDLAKDLGGASPEEFARAVVLALNETADKTYELARDRITAGLNLSDDYLRRRMRVEPATAGKPQATITASGTRSDMTRLATFDARMVIAPRTTTGRSRNRGVLGVPQGSKQAGDNVTVRRGSEKTVNSGFLLRLRQGGEQGDKFGVFIREGKRLKHLFGPSVYQLFAWQAPRLVDEVSDDLQKTLIDRVAEQLKGILQ